MVLTQILFLMLIKVLTGKIAKGKKTLTKKYLLVCTIIAIYAYIGVNLITQSWTPNAYQITGIPRYTTQEDIIRQYKHLLKVTHPDKTRDSTLRQLFLDQQPTYELLKTAEKRQEYEIYGLLGKKKTKDLIYARGWDYLQWWVFLNLFGKTPKYKFFISVLVLLLTAGYEIQLLWSN